MSQQIAVNILSDDDDDQDHRYDAVSTPLPIRPKKQRIEYNSKSTVFIIDDDPTPRKPSVGPTSTPLFVAETPLSDDLTHRKPLLDSTSTPLFMAETPLSDFSKCSVSIVKCTKSASNTQLGSSSMSNPISPGINRLICLESDNESENGSWGNTWKLNENTVIASEVAGDSELTLKCVEPTFSLGTTDLTQISGDSSLHPITSGVDIPQIGKCKDNAIEKRKMDEASRKKRITKEERIRLMEEKKQQKEQEKLQKAALKAEAAEIKKVEKEMQKWEKGKHALKSIVAEIDTKVVELGSVAGHLLTRFAEKGLTYRITSNPIERSIVWTMTVPEQISQLSSRSSVITYVLLVYEAEEFCNLVMNESLMDHVSRVQSRYPSHTVCYLTNRLMAYINKREQGQYKNPANYSGWRRPPVEEALSKLTTHFVRIHSRQCVDESELAEHVVGLTCSLASCQFRKKLTRLSVNANGSLIPKDCIDRTLIKKNLWLKALVAIPKVQPRFAISIWKKYPTMKSLLSVYMDPTRSVHEKEFLLKDLTTEGLLGEDRRLGDVCSKRVYRILMAQCGTIRTDDVEDGADFFSRKL